MNIAMISSDPLPSTGGIQTVIRQLSRACARDGHSCAVLCPGAGDEVWDGIQIHRAELSPFSLRTALMHPGKLLSSIRQCRRFLKATGASVVHFHTVGKEGFFSVIAARSLGIGTVLTVHGARDFGTMTPFGLFIEKLIYLMCRVVTTCCEADRRAVLKRHRILTSRIRTLPNAVDLRELDPHQAQQISGRVVFVGRFTIQKGVDVLLHAWGKVHQAYPNSELCIIGSGPLQHELLELSHKLGLRNVSWLGMKPSPEVIRILCSASIVCLPSRWEGMPLVALEAMAVGKPVVASAVDGIPEVVIDGETGILVPPESPEALADSLIRLLQEPKLRVRLGQAARDRVAANFTWDKIADQYLEVYRSLQR